MSKKDEISACMRCSSGIPSLPDVVCVSRGGTVLQVELVVASRFGTVSGLGVSNPHRPVAQAMGAIRLHALAQRVYRFGQVASTHRLDALFV